MSITSEDTFGQFHFTVPADVAHGNTGDLQADSGASLNDVGLALN
jgi:hypothetical protein